MENKSIEEKRNVNYFISDESSLHNEISLFKIYLTPLELFILKVFMINPSPKTTRDLQIGAINLIYDWTFYVEDEKRDEIKKDIENERNLLSQLLEENYGSIHIKSKKTTKGVFYFRELSRSKEIDEKKSLLKNEGVKFPSFDLLRGIMEGLEIMGVLKTRERERNIIFYVINPKFYLTFKDKAETIIKL
jgi:hypothetical protein